MTILLASTASWRLSQHVLDRPD